MLVTGRNHEPFRGKKLTKVYFYKEERILELIL